MTSGNFNARLKQANLSSKYDTANFVKNTDFDYKLKNVPWNKNKLKNYQKKLQPYHQKDWHKIW